MEVRFFRASNGRKPVAEYMRSLDSVERARLANALHDISVNGLERSTVTRRQVRGKLWEIKVSKQRAFYVMISGPVMVVLHAYKKEGQKAPPSEIEVAIQRMQDVLEAEEK